MRTRVLAPVASVKTSIVLASSFAVASPVF